MSFLEKCWEEREEKLFKQIFGDTGKGIYPLSIEIFNHMNAEAVDPRWLTHGVFKCPPTGNRKTWAYVTSGMSNPWESEVPEEYSGLGIEFIMETDEETDWAVDVLLTLMAHNLLLAAGQMGDFPPLDYGHRVPLVLSESITIMLLTKPISYPDNFCIKSGRVDLIQVVGITPNESAAAKATSSDELKTKTVNATGGLVTRKERDSVI